MVRLFALAGGLGGALACSQVPEFSQQYLQRLAGQVDALTVVALDFDASAFAAGLGREEALQQLSGTDFLDARQGDMRATFARHAALSHHLDVLRAAGPFERLAMPHRFADPATLQATWGDFGPAMPLTLAGAVTAATGFLVGWAAVLGALVAGLWPFRAGARWLKRSASIDAQPRNDPPVLRRPAPRLVSDQPSYIPKVSGQTR